MDLPGIYSLNTHSEEEEIARDYICTGHADLLLVVCDATCLERGLHLLKQIGDLEDSSLSSAILCVNLCDEAAKKGIHINFELLSEKLSIPVIPCTARSKRGLDVLKEKIYELYKLKESYNDEESYNDAQSYNDKEYNEKKEYFALGSVSAASKEQGDSACGAEGVGLLCQCSSCPFCTGCQNKASAGFDSNPSSDSDPGFDIIFEANQETISSHSSRLQLPNFSPEKLATQAVTYTNPGYRRMQDRLDQIATGPVTGTLLMAALLLGVFWLTITGANYPSSLLWNFFYQVETWMAAGLTSLGAPGWLIDASVYGVFRVLAWIVSVMLPPMAIFFPLFTLLEDLGYLPRAAFNMDCAFKKCHACGKQCLTMAMGLGCNAAGVVGCRIIDSPRERLIAILTNSLVPCNGRFPTLIMLITLFFMGSQAPFSASLLTAAILTLFILMGIFATLFSSWLLSKTLLKGMPSSFTLELPPYRRPQFGKVIVRSIFDRTLFVLGRAVVVAAPAGLFIWLLANIDAGGQSLLWHLSAFLDPFGQFLGLDGIILVGFILGFPANA